MSPGRSLTMKIGKMQAHKETKTHFNNLTPFFKLGVYNNVQGVDTSGYIEIHKDKHYTHHSTFGASSNNFELVIVLSYLDSLQDNTNTHTYIDCRAHFLGNLIKSIYTHSTASSFLTVAGFV